MAVTSVPRRYRPHGSHETMTNFFTSFGFEDMVTKNKESGENDVQALVLDGGHVQSVDCNQIIKKNVRWIIGIQILVTTS